MIRDNSPPALPTMEAMKLARRWLLSNASKVPFYVDGSHRRGTLDSPEDVLRLGTFDQAVAACALKGDGWNLGFALGADGTGNVWQGIDLDEIAKNCLSDLANNLPGYVEVSTSGEGAHAIGYGRRLIAGLASAIVCGTLFAGARSSSRSACAAASWGFAGWSFQCSFRTH